MRLYCYWVLHQVDLVDLADLVLVVNKVSLSSRPDRAHRLAASYSQRKERVARALGLSHTLGKRSVSSGPPAPTLANQQGQIAPWYLIWFR